MADWPGGLARAQGGILFRDLLIQSETVSWKAV
jgi:hypothetical protein